MLVRGTPVYRIRALQPIPAHSVSAGDIGGFLEGDHNLSHEGSSWIADDAMAVGRSRVEGDAILRHSSIASDHSIISGQAQINHLSRASGHAIIRGNAQLSDLAHATGSVILDGPVILARGAAVSGNGHYQAVVDIPWSFFSADTIDQTYEEFLLEALTMDETVMAALQSLGAVTPQKRLSTAVELLSTPEGRNALLRIASRAGGTFYPSEYLPLNARTISAHNAADVITFCSGNEIRNYQAICSIHPDAVIASDSGNPWHAGVIRTCTIDRPTRYIPILLEDANKPDTIAALPLRAAPAHGHFTSLLDAEAAAMDRLADLHATPRDRASRPNPITVFPSLLPMPLALRQADSATDMTVTMNGRFAVLQISDDCTAGLDLTEVTRSQEFTWRPNQLIAASNPHTVSLELPTPSPELRAALARATRAQRQKGFIIMKRDMDLVRTLLLEIEANQNINGQYIISDADFTIANADRSQVQYHLRLLMDAGYIEGRDLLSDAKERGHMDPLAIMKESGAPIAVERMTWDGHEFLETVRDNQVWQKTKGYLKSVGGVGIDVLKDVAKAVVKDQIKQYTGLEM